jgi:hypothetical protein
MNQAHRNEMQRALDARINSRFFDSRVVFLFGHCNATEEMADYLLERNIKIRAILDNSISKQGLSYREIPIVTPEQIQEYTAEKSVVLIATRFFAEMSEQLKQLDYCGEIVQVVELDSFSEYSLSDETLKRRIACVQRGAITLERIRVQYPEHHLVICPNNALGDVYWAMAFLPPYCDKHGIDKIVVLTIGNTCREVAETFDRTNTVALSETEMDEFVQAVIFKREEDCIIAHHDRPYTDKIIKYLDRHFLSFIDYYRCAVYGLTKETKHVLPCKLTPFDNFTYIPKGKSVILSPYAKSVVALPCEFWEKITADYSAEGYTVFTNVANNEKPIEGTVSLKIPVSQMPAVVEHAGTFIGIRNGLCDVLYAADCRKIVVYPDCYYSTTPFKVADFLALPEWESIFHPPQR